MASKLFLAYFILILLLSHFIFSFPLLGNCLDGINGIENFGHWHYLKFFRTPTLC
jgi:hypothetical protein